jgi:O-antigen/teichoic acid export membrane protein
MRAGAPPAFRLAAAFLQFIATLWLARNLGEIRAGDIFFWTAVLMSFGRVANMGLDELALQQVPRISDDEENLSRHLGNTRSIVIASSLAVGLLLIVYAVFVQHDVRRSAWWYAMLPIGILGVAICRINGETMKGLGHPLLAILYRQFLAGSAFLLSLVLLGARLTADLALGCFAAAFALAGFLALWGPGLRRAAQPIQRPSGGEASQLMKRGAPLFASSVFIAFTFVIPLAILERSQPPSEVSFLTTSYRIFMLFELLALAVHSIVMPRLSRAAHTEDWKLTAKIYRRTIVNGIGIMAIPLVLVALAASPLMALFGQAFREAVPLLRVFLAFSAISLLMGPAAQVVLMVGHTKHLAVFAVVRLLASSLIALFWVGEHGALAVVVAIGVGIVLQKMLCLWHFRRQNKAAEISKN